MSPNLVLVVTIAALFTAGVYLVLERSLTRVLLGVVLLGNGTNLLILVAGGAAGGPPLIGVTPEGEMSDPLPQALVLTAIVITLGLTAFLLAMAYRSWQLHRHDEVQDDVEDRRIARLAARDERAFEDADTEGDGESLDEEAASTRDETDEGGPGTASGVDHGSRHEEGAHPDDDGRGRTEEVTR
ncbi:Na(+)/H(+) antiporter subunit C [Cellulomonas sp. 179-A 9B4 NHS]|uniref:Na(+)/H(+) antiporter subunit C n=1 Tax=Cellulomonas sp. 179-A 9B4 NHS TaxID=3142379 RepID=UPI0039A16A56